MQLTSTNKKRGGTLIELTMAFVLLGVILGSLGFYLNTYERFNEEAVVQNSLKLGRLSAIPSVAMVDDNGHVIMTNEEIAPLMSMYLARSYVERDFQEPLGEDGCADPERSGAIRGFIATVRPDSPTTSSADLRVEVNTSVFTCNLSTTYPATSIPASIIDQVKSYAGKGSWRFRDFIVVYSDSNPKFGALIVSTDMGRFTNVSPSPSPDLKP